jgi:hypothetical protein
MDSIHQLECAFYDGLASNALRELFPVNVRFKLFGETSL